MTYDGSGKASGLSIFANGKPMELEIVRDALKGTIRTDAALTVGRRELGPPFVGQIDDLRLYNKALTPDEIEDLAVHHRVRVILSGLTGKPSREQAATAGMP